MSLSLRTIGSGDHWFDRISGGRVGTTEANSFRTDVQRRNFEELQELINAA